MPLTQSEIRADKDQLRAEFAMTARRLEMTVAGLQEKSAGQTVELGRLGEKLNAARSDNAAQGEVVASLEGRITALDAEIDARNQKIGQMAENLTEAEKLAARRAEELEKLGQMYDDASFLSSNRQIELVAREADLEKLATDMLALRNQRKEMEARSQAIVAESRAAREALKGEQKRVADLDKRIERLLDVVADREEKLERREKELARLREKFKGAGSAAGRMQEVAKRSVSVSRLEAASLTKDTGSSSSGEIDKALAKVNADREKLEERLAQFGGRSAKGANGKPAGETQNGPAGESRLEGVQLREQMADLAAEVVHLTAMRDGPASPIAKALANDESRAGAGEGRGHMPSLADRVRALQKSTTAG